MSPLYAPRRRRFERPQFPDAIAILEARECTRSGCPCHRSTRLGHGLTHCPAHDDDHPSLGVDERGDRVVWRCYAACSQEEVRLALIEIGVWPELRRPR